MKKLNNKGFSLVELIIVIAIMAILVGVVGTQVIPYLEKSRQAKDMQIFSAWNTAAMSAYSMNTDDVTGATSVKISIDNTTSGNYVRIDNGQKILATFKSLTGLDSTKAWGGAEFSSKAGAEVTKVEITINPNTSKVWTYIYKGATVSPAFGIIENK